MGWGLRYGLIPLGFAVSTYLLLLWLSRRSFEDRRAWINHPVLFLLSVWVVIALLLAWYVGSLVERSHLYNENLKTALDRAAKSDAARQGDPGYGGEATAYGGNAATTTPLRRPAVTGGTASDQAIELFSLLSLMLAVIGGSAYLLGFHMQSKMQEKFDQQEQDVRRTIEEFRRELEETVKDRVRAEQERVEKNLVQILARMTKDNT